MARLKMLALPFIPVIQVIVIIIIIIISIIIIIIIWFCSLIRALASLVGVSGLLVQRPTPNLEDQVSVFMTPGDRVTQLYSQALGTYFSRLLRHERVTVRIFFNAGHHMGYQLI
jgi:hypothetical protein